MSSSGRVLELLLEGFSAQDIAETLPSFDHDADPQEILLCMERRRCDVVGVRQGGIVEGWLAHDDLHDAKAPPRRRSFDEKSVIDQSASFDEVLRRLDAAPHLFVRSFGEVNGVIRRLDVQKAPVRMWLFGLVTVTELRVTRLIDEVCPEESWRRYLSEGRLQKARDLQSERLRRGQQRTLLECLQLADKGRIIARDVALRNLSRFSSQREVERFVEAFQDLRNDLAHSQDTSDDWDLIVTLASDLQRFVLGSRESPESSSETVTFPND